MGIRPCASETDPAGQEFLRSAVASAVREAFPDADLEERASSTDCNIPLSLGIPAVAIGLYDGAGAHTREEFILPESIGPGMRIGAALLSAFLR